MDLGPCAKTHSVKLKTEYEDLSRKAEAEKDEHQIKIFNTFKADYEREVRLLSRPSFPMQCEDERHLMLFVCVLQIMNFVGECDRRIAAAHRRLEKTPEENNRTTALVSW